MFDRRGQMGALRDPVSAIMGGIGLVSNVVGGIVNSRTAKSAAQQQADAARAAGKRVTDAVQRVNPQITESAASAGRSLNERADLAARGVSSAADRANLLLDPTRVAGDEATDELRRNLVSGGDFNRSFTKDDFEVDPGYQFRLAEGARDVERTQAARGGSLSGAAVKELERYRQGFASQEFNTAFQRFRQTNADRFDRLNLVAGRGSQVAGQEGSNLLRAGEYGGNITTDATKTAGQWDIGATDRTTQNEIDAERQAAEYDTQAANAIASGRVASTNALTGGITGGINAATGAIQQGRVLNLLKNPAEGVVTGPSGLPALNKLKGTRRAA